jgi:hypothetical protein
MRRFAAALVNSEILFTAFLLGRHEYDANQKQLLGSEAVMKRRAPDAGNSFTIFAD